MSVLKLDDVCFSYGKRKILNNISYDFEAGKMYAVVGKSGAKIKQKKKESIELLAKMGLDKDEAERHVLKLSGGQQQRVAIARALSYNPDIILADEPTGNLDMETQNEILEIFRNLAKEGKCVIIVTHSKEVANSCGAVYELSRI